MISTFFIMLGSIIFQILLGVLPAGTALPTQVSDALTYVMTALNSLTYILPVANIFYALFIIIAYEAVMWGFHAVVWVWKRIPIIGR